MEKVFPTIELPDWHLDQTGTIYINNTITASEKSACIPAIFTNVALFSFICSGYGAIKKERRMR